MRARRNAVRAPLDSHLLAVPFRRRLPNCRQVCAGATALLIMMHDVQLPAEEGGKGFAAIGHPAVNLDKFSFGSAFAAEVAYTFALCFVVLNVATAKANAGNQFFGLAVGFTVTAGACSGGPVSGGAFNPAVGFGLPLMAGAYSGMLVYTVGPFAGAALAAGMFYLTNLEEMRGGYTEVRGRPRVRRIKGGSRAGKGRAKGGAGQGRCGWARSVGGAEWRSRANSRSSKNSQCPLLHHWSTC